jgi:hypothetical protein
MTMAKLIGNYTIPGQTAATPADAVPGKKEENSVIEFERRALERLGGSIAFVMKGKNVIWSGTGQPNDGGRNT